MCQEFLKLKKLKMFITIARLLNMNFGSVLLKFDYNLNWNAYNFFVMVDDSPKLGDFNN
jgi:hypothetical protein